MSRILIVGNANYPTVKQRGLIGQAAGHEIHWVSAHPSPHPDVVSYALPRFARNSLILRAVLEPFLVLYAIRKSKADLLHVHHASKAFAALPISKFHPLIVSVMGADIMPDQAYRGIFAPFIRILLENADCITSKSEFMDSAVLKIGDHASKLRRITWGIDLDHFHPNRDVTHLRRRYGISESDLVLFDPRAATPFYNKHIILEAFAKFAQKSAPSAKLLILCLSPEQGYLADLKKQAKTFGVEENVHFVEQLEHREMADYYAMSNLTISVPPSDGLPQTIYEALACGSFPILGDLPQYHGIVEHGKTAYLVPVGDTEALTEAIEVLAKQADLRAQLLPRSQPYVQQHADINVQNRRMNEIYSEFLAN